MLIWIYNLEKISYKKPFIIYIISVLYTVFSDTVEEENPKVLLITSLDQSLKVCNKNTKRVGTTISTEQLYKTLITIAGFVCS